ncbi:MAG TPA: SLC13 family permease [Tenuifilaceae bacterium]|jgi:anion transporter|nr:SLC13 family permease [Bacteroidales bacterium]MDI9516489.1 SLC13 family permease [Bacteroidota bacterium]OQC62418.1 MAG: Sodium-dependent dicarboxylate transporter SdcS [Bacteroidetes bacterium ADurb.Bin008]HOF91707.1 SLC13 family permease [Tenuifilaceae bacterium]HOM85764.1 SLC13 family permease [Tenuifilaceae bacterium]
MQWLAGQRLPPLREDFFNLFIIPMVETGKGFDILDMSNYRVEKLPQRKKSGFEKYMALIGGPLAIIVFVLIYFFSDIPFLNDINHDLLGKTALKRLGELGDAGFSRINYAMLAIFAGAIILWITEAIPNYLTSLMLIITMVLTGVAREIDVYHQLGHPVMWLNILSFVMASMLVKTQAAKRFALWFIVKFGKNATWIFFSFMIINVVLTAFISATTARAAIMLPIFMVVAAVYGATGGDNRNNFGRNLVLQNLFQITSSSSGFLTGSGATLLAGALIAGALGYQSYSYQKWLFAAFPFMVLILLIGWFVGTKLIFPMKREERSPQIEGGMERLKDELHKLGPLNAQEIRAIIIFVGVLAMWATDSIHGISQTAVVFLGAVIALTPKIGVVKWNDVDIPWHLLLFSAGAYALGAGLDATDLAMLSVNYIYDSLGFTASTPFSVFYLFLTGIMLLSAIFFQSKTMRTLIFIPIAIGTAQKFGYPILSLALPVALLIEHVYALPFNSKPAALLYITDHYSWTDTAKFGFTMLVITWLMIIIWGETWLRFLEYTPNGVFGLF